MTDYHYFGVYIQYLELLTVRKVEGKSDVFEHALNVWGQSLTHGDQVWHLYKTYCKDDERKSAAIARRWSALALPGSEEIFTQYKSTESDSVKLSRVEKKRLQALSKASLFEQFQ